MQGGSSLPQEEIAGRGPFPVGRAEGWVRVAMVSSERKGPQLLSEPRSRPTQLSESRLQWQEAGSRLHLFLLV